MVPRRLERRCGRSRAWGGERVRHGRFTLGVVRPGEAPKELGTRARPIQLVLVGVLVGGRPVKVPRRWFAFAVAAHGTDRKKPGTLSGGEPVRRRRLPLVSNDLSPPDASALIAAALAEDRVRDDATTGALLDEVAAERRVRAEMLAKADGVIAGLPYVAPVFRALDAQAHIEAMCEDGDVVGAGTTLLRVETTASALLRGERTALNLVQRLSGIATAAHAYAAETMATGAQVYDTRKTTPGLRALEKYAVRCGGGHNHRMDLSDAAMIKENHLVAAYGATGVDAIAQAVKTCFRQLSDGTPLYVEVESQAELEAAVAAAGTRAGDMVVMLDDFDLGDLRRAVRWLRNQGAPRPQVEATGGVTLARVEALAAAGAQRLSVGALTHSAPALDISLKIRSHL